MGFDIRKEFIDKKKSEEGVWVDWKDGSGVKIARTNNPKYLQTLAEGLKHFQVNSRNKEITDLDNIAMRKKATAYAILVDWRGFVINGEEVPYSPEKALEFFERAPDFYMDIVELSVSRELFLEELVGESEKNSLDS